MKCPLHVCVALLMLSICAAQSSGQGCCQQTAFYSSMDIVGSTEFKGSKQRVFELDGGVQVAEPRLQFGGSCSFQRYNRLYLKYQLSLPIQLDTAVLTSALSSSKKVGEFTVEKIDVKLNAALASKSSEVTVLTTGRQGKWKLTFLCDTFDRCSGLNDELLSNPWALQQSVRFSVIGRVGNSPVKFDAISSARPLRIKDCYRGRWFVFQRRVDGNLSFKKKWDDYVKGFGHPKSNFWIGLESLFAITATRNADTTWKTKETAMCRMRIEAVDLDGKKYWSEYGRFQVMSPDENYRLRIGDEKPGSTIQNMIALHNEQQFSTYDRDHDGNLKMSCSRTFGYAGFWYGNCHSMNPNGPMTNRKTNSQVTYETIVAGNAWVQTKKIVMKLFCE